MSGTTPNIPYVLKKAGFLYDQAGTGGRDVVFADEALAAVRDLQQQLQLARGLAHDRLEQVQALQVSAGESSSEILSLRNELKAALANNAALSAMLVGRDAGDQFRKAEDRGAALDGAVTGMQEATHGISRVLATHGRTMGSDLAGELVLILSRLTAVIQQAPK